MRFLKKHRQLLLTSPTHFTEEEKKPIIIGLKGNNFKFVRGSSSKTIWKFLNCFLCQKAKKVFKKHFSNPSPSLIHCGSCQYVSASPL